MIERIRCVHLPQTACALGALMLQLVLCFQIATAQADDQFSMSGELGFGASLVAERWAPLTLTVSSGNEAVHGVLVITYAQDRTQTAEIAAPFATTPGKSVPVTVLVCVPVGCTELIVRAQTVRGKELGRVEYVPVPYERGSASRTTSLAMPIVTPAHHVLVGVVGDIPEVVGSSIVWRKWLNDTPDDEQHIQQYQYNGVRQAARSPEDAFGSIGVVGITPDRLPRTSMGYDSLTALVIHPASIGAVDQRSIDAIKVWVRSGGRLVVLATEPGAMWESWVPETVFGDTDRACVLATDPMPITPPDDLRAHVNDFLGEKQAADDGNAIAAQATARTFGLTSIGSKLGWTTRWAIDGYAGGLIAEGPVGFGYVTLVGAKPSQLTPVVRDALSAGLWRQLLLPVVGIPVKQMERALTGPREWWQFSGWQSKQQAQEIVDATKRVPVISHGIVFWILLVPLAMFVVLGFVDVRLLKRFNKREFNWLTASGWLLALSVIAYIVPELVRSGSSMARRLVLIESVQVPGDGASVECVTQAIGLYANTSSPCPLETESQDTETLQSRWWRGLEPSWDPYKYAYGRDDRRSLVGPRVNSFQMPGSWNAIDGGNVVDRLRVAQWSFRAIFSRDVQPVSVRASVEILPIGTRIVIDGLDTDEIVNVSYEGLKNTRREADEQMDAIEDSGSRVFLVSNEPNVSTSIYSTGIGGAMILKQFEPSFSGSSWVNESGGEGWGIVTVVTETHARENGWDRERVIVRRIYVPVQSNTRNGA